MKKFFSSMEERFVFPIGRRTWQILALIALLGLAAFIFWFLFNATPTGRDSVKITTSEVVENKIDTTMVVEEVKAQEPCTKAEYTKILDSLKLDLPASEWNKLGDSTEPYSTYLFDENGNYVFDEFGQYQIVNKRGFVVNQQAIPNQLDMIFKRRDYDTTNICNRTEILKSLHFLNGITESEYLSKEGIFIYCNILSENREISYPLLSKSIDLKNQIDGKSVLVKSTDDLESCLKYINYVSSNNVSDEQIQACLKLINAHRKLNNGVYSQKKYFDIAETVFESKLAVDELKNALTNFEDDIEYYDKNDFKKSLSRYLRLYGDKLSIAEMKKTQKEFEKSKNREFSKLAMLICFASIISIATILLLYSIQQLLKDKNKS